MHGIIFVQLLTQLFKRRPVLSAAACLGLVRWWLKSEESYRWNLHVLHIISALNQLAKLGRGDVLPELTTEVRRVLESLTEGSGYRKLIVRLDQIHDANPDIPLTGGEAWSDEARNAILAGDAKMQESWIALLTLCAAASGTSPSPKWSKSAKAFVQAVGELDVRTNLTCWFAQTALPRTQPALSMVEWEGRCMHEILNPQWDAIGRTVCTRGGKGYWSSIYIWTAAAKASGDVWGWLRDFANQPEVKKAYIGAPPTPTFPPEPPPYDAVEDKLIIEPHMDILRGLAWVAGLLGGADMARALTTLALSAYRKVPGKGPRAVRVGNACITALGMIGGLEAVGQLAVLKVKVKFGTAQKQIEKALAACAEKAGIPRDELEEMSVPAYGLTEVGRGVESLGDHTAELVVRGLHDVALLWRGPDGKGRKSLPAAVKAAHKDELKELAAAKKDIERMLPAQAERLDSLFLAQKSWALDYWREHYLGHPLVGVLVRRLIWNFTTGGVTTPGTWLKDQLVDRTGAPVPLEAARTRVSLWHPLEQTAEEVLAWRTFLEEREIRQPFKQAHREVYLLTPAEEQTDVYSNRFAAHVLRQHQFNALCAARGWKNKLRLMWDNDYPAASRALPAWGLRAEFWIEGAGEEYNDAGVFAHVATDQVRFYRQEAEEARAHAGGGGYHGGGDPLRLSEVPRLVFSEIMRDVDLFVGVASVGNDPAWRDGGRREQFGDQWRHFAFGELTATAQTRRDVLQRLVPKLKIAAQCSFEEKFLVVRGQRHTYKIHLGSGNILRSPNDQYLCIVASRGVAETGAQFLPFEGDSTLSLILSKALLLAADDKITDPAITRQL